MEKIINEDKINLKKTNLTIQKLQTLEDEKENLVKEKNSFEQKYNKLKEQKENLEKKLKEEKDSFEQKYKDLKEEKENLEKQINEGKIENEKKSIEELKDIIKNRDEKIDELERIKKLFWIQLIIVKKMIY